MVSLDMVDALGTGMVFVVLGAQLLGNMTCITFSCNLV